MADNDNRQSGYFAGLGPVVVNTLLEFIFQVKRDLFSVDDKHGGVALSCVMFSGWGFISEFQYSYEKCVHSGKMLRADKNNSLASGPCSCDRIVDDRYRSFSCNSLLCIPITTPMQNPCNQHVLMFFYCFEEKFRLYCCNAIQQFMLSIIFK